MYAKKNHKGQSVPVFVPIQIDTTHSLNSRAENSKITKMEFALELDFYCKRRAASDHNRKRERVYIEESRQELHHQDQLRYKDKENITDLGGILEKIRKDGRNSAVHMIRSNTTLATLASKNQVCIAAHLIRSNTALATLSS